MIIEKKRNNYSDELQKKYGRITFGRFLISWRESDGVTQSQFAKKLGISPANLCDLEQGRRIPTPNRARTIAKKLKLPEATLIAIALQDALEQAGMKYSVELKSAA